MARIPLFLFQAVQAALLPKLAHLAAAGKFAEFESGVKRIAMFVCVVIVISIPGGYLLGPFAVSILAGHAFELARIDFAFLASGSAILMLAIALGQALVALEAQWKAALGWAIGTAVFLITIAVYQADVLPRVEWSYLASAIAAATAMAVLLVPTLHSAHQRHQEISLAESLTALPVEP
jgi:O-antigen/teichoic acid export membrane protein